MGLGPVGCRHPCAQDLHCPVRDQILNLCHATSFRPFRVHTRDGTAFDVHAPTQVAFSPDGGMIVVVLSDARFEVLVPERIARCEVLHASTPPIPQAEPEPPPGPAGSPGGITFQSVIDTDGRRLVHFEATDADGHVMLSSAGTRWDLYGMEVFENGRTLYLQHADDLTLSQRIILWPPKRGTLESFAEAMDVARLKQELVAKSSAAGPRGFAAPASYARSIVPPEPYNPPMPKHPHRETGMRADDPRRFVMSARRYDAAPGQTAMGACLTDLFTEHVMFDLDQSGWHATIEDGIAKWDLTLRCPAALGRELRLHIDAFKGRARVEGAWVALEAAERHIRNFPLHGSWEALLALLKGEPRDLSQPESAAAVPTGATLEFWPGAASVAPPFLAVRLVETSGRAILDSRGAVWGAMARVRDGGVWLHLLHADPARRMEFTPRLAVDLATHRVTCDGLEGATSI